MVDCVALIVRVYPGDNLDLSWTVSSVSLALGLLTSSGRSRLLSSRATTIFVPLMVSRFMLSLKEAAAETNTAYLSPGPSEGRHIRFAPWPPRELIEVLGVSTSPDTVSEGVELESVPRMSRGDGFQLLSPISITPMSQHPTSVWLHLPTFPGGAVANPTYTSRLAWNESPARETGVAH